MAEDNHVEIALSIADHIAAGKSLATHDHGHRLPTILRSLAGTVFSLQVGRKDYLNRCLFGKNPEIQHPIVAVNHEASCKNR